MWIRLINLFKLLRYVKYIPSTLYLNFKINCSPTRKKPFFPLIATSRFSLRCSSLARIYNSPGSYLRLGYEGGGVAAFDYTGIDIELREFAILELDGISLIGYGSSICIYKNSKLKISGDTYLAGNANIKCAKSITIGSRCAISWGVTIIDSDFHPWSISGEAREIAKAIVIEDQVWIGNNVTILKGVRIGEGAIVGAASVVTKDVPRNCLVAGNPAVIIRRDVVWG